MNYSKLGTWLVFGLALFLALGTLLNGCTAVSPVAPDRVYQPASTAPATVDVNVVVCAPRARDPQCRRRVSIKAGTSASRRRIIGAKAREHGLKLMEVDCAGYFVLIDPRERIVHSGRLLDVYDWLKGQPRPADAQPELGS